MGKNITFNSEAKKARALWDNDPSWTTTFCNLCVEQIQIGNRSRGAAFSTEGWTNLVTKFCDETGQNYDKDQLKSRWDVVQFKFVLLVCILSSFLHFYVVQFKLGLLICILYVFTFLSRTI